MRRWKWLGIVAIVEALVSPRSAVAVTIAFITNFVEDAQRHPVSARIVCLNPWLALGTNA